MRRSRSTGSVLPSSAAAAGAGAMQQVHLEEAPGMDEAGGVGNIAAVAARIVGTPWASGP
jgi:hypothetical protein